MIRQGKILTAAVIGAAFMFGAASAKAEDERIYKLGEIEITDSVSWVNSKPMQEVSSEEFEAGSATSVSEALEQLPSVNFTPNSKGEKRLNIRGFSDRYIQVYFDGIPVALPYEAYIDLGNYNTFGIDKIELETAGGSVLFGPNAAGGAVNIVTAKPNKPFESAIEFMYKSGDTYQTRIGLGSKIGKAYGMLSVAYEDSDGFELPSGYDERNENGGLRDNSGYWRGTITGKVGYEFAKGSEVAFGINHINSSLELPPNTKEIDNGKNNSPVRYWNYEEWDKDTYYLLGSVRKDKYAVTARLYRDEYYNVMNRYKDNTYTECLSPSWCNSAYDDYSNGVIVNTEIKTGAINTVILSGQYKKDVHKTRNDKTPEWEKDVAETYFAGIEDRLTLGKFIISLGGSYEVNNAISSDSEEELNDDIKVFNPQATVIYNMSPNTVLHAKAARKTRFPSMKELYSSYSYNNGGQTTYFANSDLKEEKAMNYEIGIKQTLFDTVLVQANVFYSKIDDKINTKAAYTGNDPDASADAQTSDNIDDVTMQGFEVMLGGDFTKNTTTIASYAYIDAEKSIEGDDSDIVADVPEHKFYLDHSYRIGKIFVLGGRINMEKGRYSQKSDYSYKELDTYWTADLRAEVSPLKYTTIEVGVENVADEEYELSYGLPQAGRTYYAKLKMKI